MRIEIIGYNLPYAKSEDSAQSDKLWWLMHSTVSTDSVIQ